MRRTKIITIKFNSKLHTLILVHHDVEQEDLRRRWPPRYAVLPVGEL